MACATQHPAIRLVDLRSGATTHTLAGHVGGAVLSVAWNPREEYNLASGGTDGNVRLWDVRRSAGCLGVMDAEDGVGIIGFDGLGHGARSRFRGTAHAGPVNGLAWTDDARHLVSTGHDEKIRVWDCYSGANTLANFGPAVRNRNVAAVVPLIVPRSVMQPGQEMLFYPNEKDILMFDLFDGTLIKRLRATSLLSSSTAASKNTRERVTGLAWRYHNMEMISGHGDGTIRSWQPRTSEDAFVEESEAVEEDDGMATRDKKRKRQILEDIERDMRRQNVSFR